MIELRRECAADVRDPIVIRCPDTDDGPSTLARTLERVIQRGHTNVLVDLGWRIDAEALLLRELYRCAGRLREAGGQLAVISRAPGLRRLLDLTLLSQAFSVHSTRAEAMAAFRRDALAARTARGR